MNFKEEYIFYKYKDKCFKNSAELRGTIMKHFKGVDSLSIYKRIVNYQVKKYGGVLRIVELRKSKPKKRGTN